MKNKIGLKDIFVATVTVDSATAYTTSTPVRVPSVLSLKVGEKWNNLPIRGDDALQSNGSYFENVDIEMEFNYLASDTKALLFGKKFLKGGLTSNIENVNGTVALGYRSRTATNKFEMVWFYVCNVTDGDSYDVDTIGDKPKASTQKVKFIGQGRQKDNNFKFEINENDVIVGDTGAIALSIVDATIKAPMFFKTVAEPIV